MCHFVNSISSTFFVWNTNLLHCSMLITDSLCISYMIRSTLELDRNKSNQAAKYYTETSKSSHRYNLVIRFTEYYDHPLPSKPCDLSCDSHASAKGGGGKLIGHKLSYFFLGRHVSNRSPKSKSLLEQIITVTRTGPTHVECKDYCWHVSVSMQGRRKSI